MGKPPDSPRQPALHPPPPKLDDRRVRADSREIAQVRVAKPLWRPGPGKSRLDQLGNEFSLLLGSRRNARNRSTVGLHDACGIAHDEYLGMTGNREIFLDDDPARSASALIHLPAFDACTPAAHMTVFAGINCAPTEIPSSEHSVTAFLVRTSTPILNRVRAAYSDCRGWNTGIILAPASTSKILLSLVSIARNSGTSVAALADL